MMQLRFGRWSAVLTLACLLAAGEGAAMSLIHREGDASIRILLVSDDTVLAVASVSGVEQARLIALDARTGALKWRAPTGPVSAAALMATNAFYLVSKDHLEKRWLGNGGIYWSNRLDTIPAQVTKPRVKFRERVEQTLQKFGLLKKPPVVMGLGGFGGTPNYYTYQDPVPVGRSVLLHRTGMSGSGCIRTLCFEDWLLFDAKSGKLTSGGSGALLGHVDGAALIGDKAGLLCIAKGRATEVPGPINSANVFWSQPWRRHSDQLSYGGHCAFEVDQISAPDELGILDSSKGSVRTLRLPTTHSNYQSGWVLLDGQVLRYAECPRIGESGAGAGRPWFELYDLNGHCLKSVEARNEISGSSWWLAYAGRTTNGVLFRDGKRTFRVDVPSLRIERLASGAGTGPGSEEDGTSDQRLSPTGQVIYVATGNITVSSMETAVMPHELSVTARDSGTGRVLWKHIERVTMLRVR